MTGYGSTADISVTEGPLFAGLDLLIQNIVKENNLTRSIIKRKRLQVDEIGKDIEAKKKEIKQLERRTVLRFEQNDQLKQSNLLRHSKIEQLRQHSLLLDEHESSLKRQLVIKRKETEQRREALEEMGRQAQTIGNEQVEKYASFGAVKQIRDLRLQQNQHSADDESLLSESTGDESNTDINSDAAKGMHTDINGNNGAHNEAIEHSAEVESIGVMEMPVGVQSNSATEICGEMDTDDGNEFLVGVDVNATKIICSDQNQNGFDELHPEENSSVSDELLDKEAPIFSFSQPHGQKQVAILDTNTSNYSVNEDAMDNSQPNSDMDNSVHSRSNSGSIFRFNEGSEGENGQDEDCDVFRRLFGQSSEPDNNDESVFRPLF